MVYVDTAMTSAIRDSVERAWGIGLDGSGVRLPGGEESASYRFGDLVVRVGPEWRSVDELEWAYSLAARAGAQVREVTQPLARRGGGFVLVVGERPVSVWPYVEGTWADPDDPGQRTQAAGLLAALHRAFAACTDVEARPGSSGSAPPHVSGAGSTRQSLEPADSELDRWMESFHARRPNRQPLHGDVYRANVLIRDGRIVGLVDWDDVLIGPPEMELAWAAAEWGRTRSTLDTVLALRFVDDYILAGGPAERLDEGEFVQLVRDRIRMEVSYSRALGQWGVSDDPAEQRYEAELLNAFHHLGSPHRRS